MALWKTKLTIAALAAVALFSASAAKAQTACESLPNPIYMQGSSATLALWNLLGPLLADAGTNLVYQGKGSCVGVGDIESIQNGTAATLVDGPSTYWSPDGGQETCTSTGDNVDIGNSDVFQSTCDIVNQVPAGTAPTLGTFSGPTEVMTFIRPIDGNNHLMPNEISAEQANFVFGTAAGDGISPWSQSNEGSTTLPSFLYVRGPSSGTQSEIAQAILLNPASFLGYVESGTGPLITAVAGAVGTGDQSVLGIAVAGGGYDSKRTQVQALAFRGYQQQAAWLPDSSVSTFDKRNVRAGLYTVFGPFQVLYQVDQNGVAVDPAATTLLNYLNGTTPLPGTTAPVAKYEIGASMIPDCAMGVTRSDTTPTIGGVSGTLGGNTEGAIVPNTNRQHSCDCYFESSVTSSTVTCTACSGPSGCPGGYCGPNGVCEAF